MFQTEKYYSTYYGHPASYLDILANFKKPKIYLAGDSSLDNKFWIKDKWYDAVNEYAKILNPPKMIGDVCYHINSLDDNFICINCATEEATVSSKEKLNTSDIIIRDNLTKNDIIVISIGGNDIMLSPSIMTMAKLAILLLSDMNNIQQKDFEFLVEIFQNKITSYIKSLTSIQIPKKVIVCGVYFPCEVAQEGWSNNALKLINYDNNPLKVQSLISKIFENAICKIKIEGIDISYLPFHKVLDSKNSEDYVARVEPSYVGGLKMARRIIETIHN